MHLFQTTNKAIGRFEATIEGWCSRARHALRIHTSTRTGVPILKMVRSVKDPAYQHIKSSSSKTLYKLFYNKGRTSQVPRQEHRELPRGW
jgi:hypothetical protein